MSPALALGLFVLLIAATVPRGAWATAPRLPGRDPDRRPRPTASDAAARLAVLVERLVPARRSARRDAQLPDALDRLAAALRAGHALGPALRETAALVPDPLGSELRQATAALAHGSTVRAALAAWVAHPGASADVRLVGAALLLGAEAGGELARAVDRIGATLRERRELHGEVRALATQARTSAAVLAITPLAFTGLVASIEPSAVAFLVTTPVGLACLAVGLGLEALGATWMARITASAR